MKRILLFDIDGTLISTGGAGAKAGPRAAGDEDFVSAQCLDLAGRQISRFDVRQIEERRVDAREATAELSLRILARYTELLPSALASADTYRKHDGVADALATLKAQGRPFGLCTGNVIEGARAKLAHGSLWEPFAQGFLGGFGSDGEIRADIVRSALRRAAERHGPVHPEQALVIGDTPKDVSAAHAVGVPALAVASGRHSLAELRDTGAEYVVETLATREALVAMELLP